MTKSVGTYIYGFARPPLPADLGEIGVEHEGKPGRIVIVTFEDLCVVTSEFSNKERIRPVRKNLDAHHKVIREVMKTTTLLPMTFGQVARSTAEVVRALRRNHAAIGGELDRVADKVEMVLRVVWDVDNIFEYLVAEDPELRVARDQTFGRSVAPTQGEKLELGKRFEERLDAAREEHTERVLEAFEGLVAEAKENPPKHEKMVMNLAFLVPRERQKSFEEQVYLVAGRFPAEFTFDINGPWAPFNFVELQLEFGAARAA